MKKFDAIIIGLGAYGSALSLALSKEGVSVLGIDMYHPPHSFGSSHGDSRIARLSNCEGEVYTKLAIRSRIILKEIEKKFDVVLMQQTGGLIISSPVVTEINHVPQVLKKTIRLAKKYSIKHQVLSAKEIVKKYQVFNLKGNETGYFEEQSAIYFPENCIKINLRYAKQLGSVHKTNERVIEILEEKNQTIVITNRGRYSADKVYLTAGPWNNYFLQKYLKLAKYITIYKQKLLWFVVEKNFLNKYKKGKFPVFVWELPGKLKGIYGFPCLSGGSIKVATEQYATSIDPNKKDTKKRKAEEKDFYTSYIKPNFMGITSRIQKKVNCMYSVTPDNMFLVRNIGKYKNIVLVSCCSGHGFKHSYAITEAIAQIHAKNKSNIDISSFKKIKKQL